uniref:Uncharacterized protein ALNC14_001260 n=1 Tax=Albugo laibachii Nc14 TaxID=890382 RepID=F0VYW8_9STRA|nr:unnamed protein product [Albugo laibachii Nc14]|eukprot:CCA13983.1 unnamed protein product [Albugo laibachii Nc14]
MTGPQVLQVVEFASARAYELKTLHQIAHSPSLYSQTDAKNLQQRNQRRRRANAFHSYRIPQRLRHPQKRTKQHTKPPNRNLRRRHPRLLQERALATTNGSQITTSQPPALLEKQLLHSHFWHAKRMKMIDCWGFQLPQHRCDKSVSAALTALRKTAVVSDLSYYGILELCGSPQQIDNLLRCVSDPLGIDLQAEKLVSGHCDGQVLLYHFQAFPRALIGPASFMWRPCTSSSERQLWVWIHPAAYIQAASAISLACEHINSENHQNSIQLFDRRGELARFQIRGRGTASILSSLCSNTSRGASDCMETQMHGRGKNLEFLRRELKDQRRNGKLRPLEQNQVTTEPIIPVIIRDPRWRESEDLEPEQTLSLMSEPASHEIPANSVYCPISGADITASRSDPDDLEPDSEKIMQGITDLTEWKVCPQPSPLTQTKDTYTKESADHLSVSPQSLLWSSSGRNAIASNFTKDHTLNQLQYLHRRTPTESRAAAALEMHLMLIKRSNTAFPDLSGWDILLLPSHSVILIEALSALGAMVIGLEENHAISTTGNTMSFPADYPDTQAGQVYWSERAMKELEHTMRRPKGKRLVPKKALGRKTLDFAPSWNELGPKNTSEAWVVLRNEAYMQSFNFVVEGPVIPTAVQTLVPVLVSPPRRGYLEINMRLYVPNLMEIQRYEDPKWQGTRLDSTQSEDERILLGFVTSAVYDRPKGRHRGIGFCGADQLQHVASLSGTGTKQESTFLAMICSQQSVMLRPVHLSVLR